MGKRGATGGLGPYRSSGAGAGGCATWLGNAGLWRAGAALLYPRAQELPQAPAQGNPQRGAEAAGAPSPPRGHRGVPLPAPGARGPRASPPPGAPKLALPPLLLLLLLLPGRSDNYPRGTPRALALQTALAGVTPAADPHSKA